MLQAARPRGEGIVDITDHTAGSNPYSPPRKSKGAALLRPYSPRLLLLLRPSRIARVAFVEAARRLGVDVTSRPNDRAPSSGPTHRPRHLRFRRPGACGRAGADVRLRASRARHRGGGRRHRRGRRRHRAGARAAGESHRGAAAARDKHQQRQLLAAAGVAVPRFELRTMAADPERLAHGAPTHAVEAAAAVRLTRVVRADDPPGFVAAFRRIKAILEQPDLAECGDWAGHVLVEEFVPGREVAVEGLVTQGSLRVLAMFDKPDPLDVRFSRRRSTSRPPTHADAQEDIAACAQAAVRALGLREGPIHAEIRHNDRAAWLIELAARPSVVGAAER